MLKAVRKVILLFALICASSTFAAEISKADKIFMKRGLVIHALCFPDNVMHLKTLADCGFTGVTWPGKSNMKQLGPPPGIPWAKWMMNDNERDVAPEEKPYESNLVALQFHDEQNLNDDKTLANAKRWFDEMRGKFPNVILYTNQYGGLLTDANMQRYIETCKPDMLSFDTYPMWEKSVNWRSYFGDLQRYRAFSAGANIPFACWMQTFHGEDKYRDPSESELRLDVFGAWTFGAKMQTCFTYNAGSSSLFKKTFNGSGDTTPQPAYEWMKRINFESRNLSPYLVKLRCVDAQWILGKGSEYPWGVGPWKYDEKLPQLRGFKVDNLSQKNKGQEGDVALGLFKPLDGKERERWIMVTNALTDPIAASNLCTQKITLNLVLDKGAKIQKVNRATGKLETPKLKKVGEADRALLELELPGGTGDLICITLGNN
jgi:hypothetical protein